jgi:hypothetical protein
MPIRVPNMHTPNSFRFSALGTICVRMAGPTVTVRPIAAASTATKRSMTRLGHEEGGHGNHDHQEQNDQLCAHPALLFQLLFIGDWRSTYPLCAKRLA